MDKNNNIVKIEPLMIVISGPSAVGKDTIVKTMKDKNIPFHFVVTTTSRNPRPGEVESVDYNFVSRSRFEEMIANDELVEYAQVYQDYKGVPKNQVRQAIASGKDVVMRVDVQGAATIHKKYPESVLIFIMTENEEQIYERLRKRRSESEEELQLRLITAKKEITRIPEYDYIVYNRTGAVDAAIQNILCIIQAEHCRVNQRKINL